MIKHREINGKAVRDEVKLLLTTLLMGETAFDRVRIHTGGFETINHETAYFTQFNLKQTEQEYMISRFLKHSRYKWKSSENHHEGDKVHFGKTYEFVKVPD